jgi:hypothetical protein
MARGRQSQSTSRTLRYAFTFPLTPRTSRSISLLISAGKPGRSGFVSTFGFPAFYPARGSRRWGRRCGMLTCKSPRRVMAWAHGLANAAMPAYSCKRSRKDFTRPRLLDQPARWYAVARQVGCVLAIDSTRFDTHRRSRHYGQRCRPYAASDRDTADRRPPPRRQTGRATGTDDERTPARMTGSSVAGPWGST